MKKMIGITGAIKSLQALENRYVNKTPQMCSEYGLHYIEAQPVQNIGQYTDSNGNVISPEKTPFFLNYIVTK